MSIKSLLFSIFCVLASASSYAYDFEYGGIYYNITDATNRTVEVTEGTTSYTGQVNVPPNVSNGSTGIVYSVTKIGSNAFLNSKITSVTLPSTLKTIGLSAFQECSSITSITIPNLVTTIEVQAFHNCDGLTSITIPNSMTTIQAHVFYGCDGLTSITIPASVTTIGEFAFAECKGLTSLTISSSATTIDQYAFEHCPSLAHIYSLSETPPACRDGVFSSSTTTSATLHVPSGTRSAYSVANIWKDFTNIVENSTSGIEAAGGGGIGARIAGGKLLLQADTHPQVRVYALSGKLVLQGVGNGLDVSALASGIYIVDADGERSKVVKE